MTFRITAENLITISARTYFRCTVVYIQISIDVYTGLIPLPVTHVTCKIPTSAHSAPDRQPPLDTSMHYTMQGRNSKWFGNLLTTDLSTDPIMQATMIALQAMHLYCTDIDTVYLSRRVTTCGNVRFSAGYRGHMLQVHRERRYVLFIGNFFCSQNIRWWNW